jgi:serine/threonine protein phosphatase 1
VATIAVGDIHGNLHALSDLLEQVRDEVGEWDTVVFLGDYIDRGADSRGCVDAILSFQRETPARIKCLIGNHEAWLLKTHRDHSSHSWLLGMDGLQTVRSYSLEAEQALLKARRSAGLRLYTAQVELPYHVFFDAVPESHRRFFSELETAFDGPDCICSHAGVNPRSPHPDISDADACIWGAAGFPGEYRGNKTIVYGHWNNAAIDESGAPAPRVVGRTIGIDTISHGVLTAFRMPDRRVFQSRRYAVR